MVNLKKINKYEFGKSITPEKIYNLDFKNKLNEVYEKLYSDNFNYMIITNLFFISILLSLMTYIFLYPYIYVYFNAYFSMGVFYSFIIDFVGFFLVNLFIYYFLILAYFFSKQKKFKEKELEIEKNLPEFIDNLVSNLKGGISLEKALLKSVRKEQKALLEEVTLINEKVLIGRSVLEALREFRKRFSSSILNRTIFLIEEGIESGGNLAKPLEEISKNLKKIYMLNDEIKAGAGGFSVVIKIISLFVAPLLFALAITLLNFIGNLFSLLSKSGTDFLSVSAVPIEFIQYLKIFSYAMIILIVLFSSLIVSQLKNEETFEAIKYLPLNVLISIFLYWQFSSFLLSLFNGIFG